MTDLDPTGGDRPDATALGLRARKKEKTRHALETAALELFAEKGFDGTTVDEIAEACDVSPRTFFRYYGSKEDVLFVDGDERLEALLAELANRPADEQPVRSVQAAFLATTDEYAQDRERLVLRSRAYDSSSGLRSHKFERQRSWEEAVTAALKERDRLAGGTTPDLQLRLVAGAAMACLHAAMYQWLESGGDLQALVSDGFDYLVDGLSTHDAERVSTSA
ncbi:MAG TPA: TetR family transcriptional regulator [Acidimicrobiia bacterium]